MIGIWVAGGGVIPAESGSMGEPQERWTYTTKGHFSLYGLLALMPIYRDQIRSVTLDPEHVYLAVLLARGGVLFRPAGEVQFLALDRQRGRPAWERRLPFNGYPIVDQLIPVGARLVAALFEEGTNELVILAMNRNDGSLIWRVSLPRAQGPKLVGDELRLDADPSRELLIVTILGANQRHQLILRADAGVKVGEATYRGYTWPSGARRALGLTLGYEGDPSGISLRKYERLLAFHETTGELAWSLPLLPKGASPPSVFENSLLIANGDRLLRIELRSGQPRWQVNLGGRIAPEADPPAVIGSRIAVAHTATPDPEDKQWKLSIRRLADGGQEAEVALHRGEMENFKVLRRMGDLLIVGSYFMLQVVDPHAARILASLEFEKLFSSFVYADPPAVRVADSDAEGFAVVTTDARLRYFAAEDFRGLIPSPAQ